VAGASPHAAARLGADAPESSDGITDVVARPKL